MLSFSVFIVVMNVIGSANISLITVFRTTFNITNNITTMTLKVLGRVDLATGKIYDIDGKEIVKAKPAPFNRQEIDERLERRRAWLAGF